MAATVPKSMQAIALTQYSKPSDYDFATLPTPEIQDPTEVLIKVYAASVNPVDVKMASGIAKAMSKDSFPYKIGYDVSGVVVAVGPDVKSFRIGDEVYARVPQDKRGTLAEYAISPEFAIAKKPAKISFTEAAAVPLVALTALQCMEDADKKLEGGLKGKTVLVPGGLSGTGSFAVQLAKNVFEAKEVITTLSTGKISKAKALFGENVFTPIDYTKEDVAQSVGAGTVDYLFDTMKTTTSLLKTVKRGGVIVSVSTIASGTQLKNVGMDVPVVIRWALDFIDWGYRWWCGRAGVTYWYQFMRPSGADLDKLSAWITEGKITPIVGRTAKFSDLEGIRQGCTEVYDGKGGVGKFVVEMF
ncbi:hypothetical protein BP5796_00062 [Coleophoma crateriformis]|uniref:Enoyl reductase (ER) domain-containing protein n=1 Tax=Coleophoma crateriformis TaxID=565419 RepID=A0A3D8T6Y6_9HELO|nr:hypothetical protein BP5796_00062 [Coleophoma crateriformis]